MPSDYTKNGETLSVSFDLDGTLVDTAPDLIRVLNEISAQDGVKPVPLQDARHLIGQGSMALIQKAYSSDNIELPVAHAKMRQQQFLDLYMQDLSQLSRPFPGVDEVLTQLKRGGARLSVCTNKPGKMARPLLEQLNLSHFFDKIVGAEDTPAIKPAAQHIFTAVGHRGVNPIVMIGDGASDFYAAKAAKIPVILMSYGYCTVPIHSFGADAVLRSFRELPSALKEIFSSN